MSRDRGVLLSDLVHHFGFRVVRHYDKLECTRITVADVTRPGLQLSGYFKHFGPDRLQIIGNMEYSYLLTLSDQEAKRCISQLFATGIPCLILSRGHEAFPVLLECSERYEIPLLESEKSTASLYSSIVQYLNIELAPRCSMHGVLVEVLGEGVLMMGESGVGKSETALELVKRGHRLIADDLVEIRRISDTVLRGRAPDIIRYMIEIRGLGILNVKELYGMSAVKAQENIHFVINFENWDETKAYNRLGVDDETMTILGVTVPSITIPVRPGRNLASIVEFAAINLRNKRLGYSAASEIEKRASESDALRD